MLKIIGTLDTSVILRFLSKDDPDKSAIFLKLIEKAGQSKAAYLIPDMVIAEIVFTLAGKYYNYPRSDIASLVMSLAALPQIQLEDRSAMLDAVDIYSTSTMKFGDAVILAKARNLKATPIYTFDAHFTTVPDAKVM
jgi:predicted nucleic acid-binding protein